MTFLAENAVLIFVLGFVLLIAVIAWAVTSSMAGGYSVFSTRERRLGLVQAAAIGNGRRLILIRRDNVEHLIMTGGPVDVVIETGIGRAHPAADGRMDNVREIAEPEFDGGGRPGNAAREAAKGGAPSRFDQPPHEQAETVLGRAGSLFRKLRQTPGGEHDGAAPGGGPQLTAPVLKAVELEETREVAGEAGEKAAKV